jgi:hypothetical protein
MAIVEARTLMKRSLLGWLAAASAIIVFAGCSTGPQIVSEWSNPGYGTGLFKRVMVAGPSGDSSIRRNLEDDFVGQLRAAGIDALASYRAVSDDQTIDEAKAKGAAQKAGADALLFARSVRVESKIESSGFYPSTSFGWFGGNFGASWTGFGAPSPRHYNEYTSETTLYDVPKNEVVWTGTIKTAEPENARTAIRAYVETVMKTLDEKNLIRRRQ